MACFLNQAVLLHLELKEVRIAGRCVGDGIGTSCNGGFDTFLTGSAGGHDGKIRVAFPNLRYDGGCLCPTADIENIHPCLDSGGDIRLVRDYGINDGNVNHLIDGLDSLDISGTIDYYGKGPFGLGKKAHIGRTVSCCQAAPHSCKDWHRCYLHDAFENGWIGRKGVDSQDRIRIVIGNDGNICGKDD